MIFIFGKDGIFFVYGLFFGSYELVEIKLFKGYVWSLVLIFFEVEEGSYDLFYFILLEIINELEVNWINNGKMLV